METVLVFSIVAVMLGHTALQVSRGRWLCFDPINSFWAGVLIVSVLDPLKNSEVYKSWHATGVMETALGWSLFGVAWVVVGYELSWGPNWARHIPDLPSKLGSARLFAAGVLMVGAGIVGYWLFIGTAGSFREWLSEGRGKTDFEALPGYINVLPQFLPGGIALLLFEVEIHKRAWAIRSFVWTLALITWLWLLYLGTRGGTISLAIMCLAAFYLPRRRNPPIVLLALVAVGLHATVTFQAKYRHIFTDLSFHLDDVDLREFFAHDVFPLPGNRATRVTEIASEWDDFNCLMATVELVPKQVPYNCGYALLELVTHPIPRSIWPGKFYPHYEAFTPIMDMGNISGNWQTIGNSTFLSGPCFGFTGHWYAMGGPVALGVAGVVTGAFLRMLRGIYERNKKSESDIIIYGTVLIIGFLEAATVPLFWLFHLPAVWIALSIILFWAGQPSLLDSNPKPVLRRRGRPQRARVRNSFE